MASSFYGAVALTGGGTGALDDINHNNLSDGDGAIVIDAVNDKTYFYTYNSSSAATESSPNVIIPDSNSGNGRWILTNISIKGGFYVDSSESDQGATGDGASVKAYVDSIGSNNGFLYFAHTGSSSTTTYTFSTNETIPANIVLVFEKGAYIDPTTTTLTIENTAQIVAGRHKIFDDSVTFTYGAGPIYPEWFGENATPGTTNMATAIQAAVDSAETIGTSPSLGIGATISFSGKYATGSTITINHDGIYLVGEGKNNTIISNTGTNINTVYFGAADPTTDLVYGGGVKDMTLAYTSNDPSDGAHIYLDRTARQTIENCHLRDHYRGAVLVGSGENNRISNCDVEQGTNITGALQSGSYGILIAPREVDSGEPNAIEDPDDAGVYYEEPNSVFISDCNIKTISSEKGFDYGIVIHAVDGLYLDNCHIGSGVTGAVRIYPEIGTVPLCNLVANNVFIDQNTSQNALHGIRYIENAAATSPYVFKHTWSGVNISGFDNYGILMQGDWSQITFSGGCIRNSGYHGIYAQDGANLIVSGLNFYQNNYDGAGGATSTYQHINLNDIDGATITGCVFDGNSNTYRGVQTAGTSDDIVVVGCHFKNHADTSVHSSVWFAAANNVDNKVSGCVSDVSLSVASAADIELPLEHDVIYITGTTNITSIDTNNEIAGYSGFNGKVVTLIFAGVLTFTDGNNLKLAGNMSTTADDTITLAYYNENWYEVSRSAN